MKKLQIQVPICFTPLAVSAFAPDFCNFAFRPDRPVRLPNPESARRFRSFPKMDTASSLRRTVEDPVRQCPSVSRIRRLLKILAAILFGWATMLYLTRLEISKIFLSIVRDNSCTSLLSTAFSIEMAPLCFARECIVPA